MRVRQHKEEDARQVNQRNTVGICPVRNAAGQKPVACFRADFIEYAAKVAQTEWGSAVDDSVVYLWSIDVDTPQCTWGALSHYDAGQYPDEAVVLAGRIDTNWELL